MLNPTLPLVPNIAHAKRCMCSTDGFFWTARDACCCCRTSIVAHAPDPVRSTPYLYYATSVLGTSQCSGLPSVLDTCYDLYLSLPCPALLCPALPCPVLKCGFADEVAVAGSLEFGVGFIDCCRLTVCRFVLRTEYITRGITRTTSTLMWVGLLTSCAGYEACSTLAAALR